MDRVTFLRLWPDLVAKLSPNEHTVCVCIMRGERQREIALRSGMSERTVRRIYADIRRKLAA